MRWHTRRVDLLAQAACEIMATRVPVLGVLGQADGEDRVKLGEVRSRVRQAVPH
jgi:hypothetical protein